MYAVIETGGKQYRVEVGTVLEVEKLAVEAGQTVTLERVLLVADGDEAAIGRPVVEGASVSAEVVRQDRADKLIVFKYRPKARRRVKKGHRQDLTVLRISDITLNGKSAAAAATSAKEARKTERERVEEAAAKQAAADAALAAKLAEKAEKREKAEKTEKAEQAREAVAETKAKPARTRAAKAAAKPAKAAEPAETADRADTAETAEPARAAEPAEPVEPAETTANAAAEEPAPEVAKPRRRATKKDE